MLHIRNRVIITSVLLKCKEGVCMKTLLNKYKHAWVFLYGLIYFPWFVYLEKTVTERYYVIHTSFDEIIPFMEIFIIPYLLWFGFVAITMLYFFFTDKNDFYRLSAFLFTGMTIFLIISTLYPNGQILRPEVFERDNIFVDLVKRLYATDTPTNIFPSIHVYNSIGAYVGIRNSQRLQGNKFIQHGSFILATSIILSTMFLKQHSVVDVLGAFVLAMPIYYFAYMYEPQKSTDVLNHCDITP